MTVPFMIPYKFTNGVGNLINAAQLNTNFQAVDQPLALAAPLASPKFLPPLTWSGSGFLYSDAGGNWLIGNAQGVMRTLAGPTASESTPHMAGISSGVSAITPAASGTVLVIAVGGAVAGGANYLVQLAYGTGNGPVGGAAATGTPIGPQQISTTGNVSTFGVSALLSGLTIGQPYWFDLRYTSILSGITLVAVEW